MVIEDGYKKPMPALSDLEGTKNEDRDFEEFKKDRERQKRFVLSLDEFFMGVEQANKQGEGDRS